MEEERSRGILYKFNDVEGMGVIKADEAGIGDLLFHHSDIISKPGYGYGYGFGTPKEGQVVEFLVILDGDQIKAVDITGPNGSPLDRNKEIISVSVPNRLPFNRNEGRFRSYGARGGYGNSDGGGRRIKTEYRRRTNTSNSNSTSNSGISEGEECNNCGRTGHLANDCESLVIGSINSGGGECYNCGKTGHLAKDCDTIVRVVRNGVGSGGRSGECYNCGKIGHLPKDCDSLVRNGCKSSGKSYSSSSSGHFAKDCDKFAPGECYNCEKTGHLAKDCDTLVRSGGGGGGYSSSRGSSGGGGGGGNISCSKCGGLGHLARYCRQVGSGDGFYSGGKMCFKCGGFGHFARQCTIVE